MAEYTAQPGEYFRAAVIRVQKELIKDRLLYGHFTFNGVGIVINQDSNIDDLCVIYDLNREVLRYMSKDC